MDLKLRLIAMAGAAALFLIVFELVRRRRLLERYALLWLACSGVLVALSAWQELLLWLSSAVGVYYPPTALFVIAFMFCIALLLHFSVAVSRLADQSKILAQRLARTEQRLARLEAENEQRLALAREARVEELPTIEHARTGAQS